MEDLEEKKNGDILLASLSEKRKKPNLLPRRRDGVLASY